MELTLSEQKILRIAATFTNSNLKETYNAKISRLGFVGVGIIGGSITVIDGIVGLASNQHDALREISCGLLGLGIIGGIYENARFKNEVISLVNKLTSEQKAIKAELAYSYHSLKSPFNFVWLCVGAIGVAITIIYGLRGLVAKENDTPGIRGGLSIIVFVLLLISFLGFMFENLKFRHSALSLIRKLTREEK